MPGLLRLREEPQVYPGSLEIVVPYTGHEITARVLQAAESMVDGLNAMLKVVAVYVVPFPAELRCPAAVEEHLLTRLAELTRRTGLPTSVQVVVARDRDAGLRHVLRPQSAILLGSARRMWRTREEKLARKLTSEGHQVSLLRFT